MLKALKHRMTRSVRRNNSQQMKNLDDANYAIASRKYTTSALRTYRSYSDHLGPREENTNTSMRKLFVVLV